MKRYATFLVAFLVGLGSTFATANTHYRTFYKDYGNSFIFVEQGVEFAVFPDGQFDFNVDNYGPNFSAYADFGGVSISFNSGYGYDAYVQYDDFGAVIQIENVPIYYDYYGRIIQAGNVHIRYNNRGYVSRVGGMYIHYNRYNRYSHYTGFINVYNRHYVYRPWHAYYVIPVVNLCVVYNRPYRQYYTPIRHTYYRPYRDNYRPQVSYNAGRRGSRDAARNTTRRSDRYRQDATPRRGDVAQNSRPLSRNDRVTRDRPRRDDQVVRGRPMERNDRTDKVKPRGNQTKPRVNGRDTKVKPRGTTQGKPRVDRRKEVKRERPAVNSRPQARPQSKKRVASRTSSRKQTATPKRSTQNRAKASTSRSSKQVRQKTTTRSSRSKANTRTSRSRRQ